MKNNKRSDEEIFLDSYRQERCGFPEFIYGEGKTFAQLEKIVCELCGKNTNVLITRLDKETGEKLVKKFPQGKYRSAPRLFEIENNIQKKKGTVSVVCAGTSDIPVAEEALFTLKISGVKTNYISDVGVAGIHRLFDSMDKIKASDIVIVAAGMEGALPSVVAGMIPSPVIAVPTSIGYGASFEGLAALLSMLNSCASGMTVVNIDNGFGAACAAIRMLNMLQKKL